MCKPSRRNGSAASYRAHLPAHHCKRLLLPRLCHLRRATHSAYPTGVAIAARRIAARRMFSAVRAARRRKGTVAGCWRRSWRAYVLPRQRNRGWRARMDRCWRIIISRRRSISPLTCLFPLLRACAVACTIALSLFALSPHRSTLRMCACLLLAQTATWWSIGVEG